jgi:hypothetical protein
MSAVSVGDFRGLVLGAPFPVASSVGGQVNSFREGSRPRVRVASGSPSLQAGAGEGAPLCKTGELWATPQNRLPAALTS